VHRRAGLGLDPNLHVIRLEILRFKMPFPFDIIDHDVMAFLSKFAESSEVMNRLIVNGSGLNTFKLLPIVICLWYFWFDSRFRDRLRVIQGFVGTFVAILVARIIQDLSSQRLRPLHSGDPAFVSPAGLDVTVMEHWSTFPSDHAAMSFALSTAVFRVSRPLGTACMLWSFFVVNLPRVYAGYHYISDIIGGAVIGIMSVLIIGMYCFSEKLYVFVSKLERQWTGLFYVAFFVMSYQTVTLFADIRRTSYFLLQHIR
jgi:membrane-associated phospholipid phosphatase